MPLPSLLLLPTPFPVKAVDGEAHTLWELTQTLFPRVTRGMDYFLALSEVLGHLGTLEAAGQAAPQSEAGVARWRRL